MAGGQPDPRAPGRRPRILFISADPVGVEMAGLGIRYWELARTLGSVGRVTVAHGGREEQTHEGVRTAAYEPHSPAALRPLIDDADVIVTHPQWPLVNRWLRGSRARVVIDLYDPETLETLELLSGRPPLARRLLTAATVDRLHDALRTAHHFMCASEKQRDLWLGAMLALRLLSPEIYDNDTSLRGVIDVVPFGVPDQPPAAIVGAGPRERLSGLEPDAELVLWNGGIWGWLDAVTPIRAVAELAQRRPRVHLVFMGVNRSHPAAAAAAGAAVAVARDLGVLGTVVRFQEGWIPYEQRGAWLAQSNCAVTTHGDNLETRFAFRTRVLDCFWGGLPVVCTTGDALAERVGRDNLGSVVDAGDVGGLGAALEHVLERGRSAYAGALRAAASEFTWSRAARPLRDWTLDPALPARPADAPGVLGPGFGQRAREAAYLAFARPLLARRART